MSLLTNPPCFARPLWRCAFFALALVGAVAARAASPIGQSFTVSGTGSVSLVSITFQNVTFPYGGPGTADVLNIFAYDPNGLGGGSDGYDDATPILFTSTGFSTAGNLTTYTFTGAALTGGASYFAVFDKGSDFTFNSSNTFAGGDLLIGNQAASNILSGYDAAGFAVTTVSAVPEPATYATLVGALALGAVGVFRRRRAAVSR